MASSGTSTATTLKVYRKDALDGMVALVTGGGSGICLGMAESLMRHGASCCIVSRTQSKLDAAAADLTRRTGRPCLAHAADVRDMVQVEAAVQATVKRFGKLDLLVNGAAGNFLCPLHKLSSRAFQTVVDIDLVGTFNVTRAAFEHLRASRGKVINVSATLQYTGMPLVGHASAAKAGIDALTRTLAVEWGPLGIRVNAIAPGPIAGTVGMDKLTPQGSSSSSMASTVPLQRLGTIADIEQATVFLASAAGDFISGHLLVVDGGAWLTQGGVFNAASIVAAGKVQSDDKSTTSKL